MMVTRGSESPKHIGTTLANAHHYLGDGDSSDGVYFWNEEKGEIGCDMSGDAYSYQMERTIDAPADMQEKARLWIRDKVKSYIPGLVQEHNEVRAQKVTKGDTVRVVRGRKVPKGTVGKVFWEGESRFGLSVGLALSDKKDASGKYAEVAFTAPSNLEVVNPPIFSLTDAEVEEICDGCGTVECYATLYKNVEYRVKRVLGIYK